MNERLIVIAATVLALGFGATAHAVWKATTNKYSATSTSDNMNYSCKLVYATSASDGEIKGQCNYKNDAGEIKLNTTTFDLDNNAGCNSSDALSWNETGLGDDAIHIKTSLDSTGGRYEIWGRCKGQSIATGLDLNTKLKNDGGVFKTR